MHWRAQQNCRLQTIAEYWVRQVPDRGLAGQCAWDQAEREGLQFDRKEINAALRRAWNRTPDAERDALLAASTAHLERRSSDASDRWAPVSSVSLASPPGPGPNPRPGPSPGGTYGEADNTDPGFGSGEAETDELLKRHEAGLLVPHPILLGSMPEGATESMRLVAEDIALLLGLRIAVDDDRPLMYSTRFCASRMGWKLTSGEWDKRRASRVLTKLMSAGVIRHVGDMPGSGTRLYAAPLQPAVVRPGPEIPALGLEARVQPSHEVREQTVVDHTQAVLGDDLGVVASRDGAAAGDHCATSYAGRELHTARIPSPPYP
jgi:hypothetical protein